MKRKFWLYTFALVLVLPIVFLASACKKDPYPTSIIFVNSAGTEYESDYNLGSFEYGTDVDVFEGLEIYQKMSDKSKQKLQSSNYTIKYYHTVNEQESEIANLPEELSVGKYRIAINTDKVGGNIYFTIDKASADYHMVMSKRSWKYNEVGATLTIYNTDATNIEYYYIAEQDYASLTPEQKANLLSNEVNTLGVVNSYNNAPGAQSIAPGTYYAFAFVPETETVASCITAISDRLKFTVDKASLTINQALINDLQPTYDYYLTNQAGNITLSDINVGQIQVGGVNVDINWANPNVEVNGSNSGSHYDVVASISNEEHSNYYNLSTEGTLQLPVTINKGSLNATPSFIIGLPNAPEDLIFAEEGYDVIISGLPTDANLYQITLNGSPITLNEDKYHIVNAGEYAFAISIKDEYKNNFVWYKASNDETFAHSNPITKTYTIFNPEVLNVSGDYIEYAPPPETPTTEEEIKASKYMNIMGTLFETGFDVFLNEDTNSYSAQLYYQDSDSIIYGSTTNEYPIGTDPNYNENMKINNLHSGSPENPIGIVGYYKFTTNSSITEYLKVRKTFTEQTFNGTRSYEGTDKLLGNASINGGASQDITDNKAFQILEYSAIDIANTFLVENMDSLGVEPTNFFIYDDNQQIKFKSIASNGTITCESIFIFERTETDTTYKLIGEHISYTDTTSTYNNFVAQMKLTTDFTFDLLPTESEGTTETV